MATSTKSGMEKSSPVVVFSATSDGMRVCGWKMKSTIGVLTRQT